CLLIHLVEENSETKVNKEATDRFADNEENYDEKVCTVENSGEGNSKFLREFEADAQGEAMMNNEATDGFPSPPQNVITRREGERATFKYFSSTLSDKNVKWVNEVKESRPSYDILVVGKDKSQEYIEANQ
ncbi:histidine kinase-, DNA gyrase B-, and HSP90-like ATPase family protein, partial [Tanacetum coccineum]